MTRILWQLTMALAFQVAVGMVPNGGVDLKKSRHLRERQPETKTAPPEWQTWMWASMALGAAGAMGACGARRCVRKQKEKENVYELLPDDDTKANEKVEERTFSYAESEAVEKWYESLLATSVWKVAEFYVFDCNGQEVHRGVDKFDEVPDEEFWTAEDEWPLTVKVTLVNKLVDEINSLGFLDILQRHKTVLLVKGVVGIGFRTIDFGLDVRAGTKFYADGDVWWCGILFAVILVSPLSQYLYIKYQRGKAANALAYLVPGSVKHLQREITNMRFIAKLPQLSLYRNVHKAVATGILNEILAGLECGLESLPQAILQLRAYAVKGGDWVNRLSIAFSLLGVAVGVVLGLKAILNQKKQEAMDIGDTAVDLPLNAGQCVDLQQCPMDDQTADAVLWLAEHDRDLCTWNWSKCLGMNDALMLRFAKKCPHLVEIYLKFCDLTDDGIQEMAHGCKDLTMVNLFECKAITDASVKELAKNCTGMTNINLGYCEKITDDAVKDLAEHCTGLTKIILERTNVTDAGLKELAKYCKNLISINLNQCSQVTDDRVKDLASNCKGLTAIELAGTKVTHVGVEELKKKLPKCKVYAPQHKYYHQ